MSRMSHKLLVLAALSVSLVLVGCPPTPPVEDVPPVAAFTAAPVSGSPPLQVQFTDQSTPGSADISRWDWDFGDGTRSSQRSPVHTYNQTGAYTVALTVTTSVGTDSERKESFILVQAVTTPPTAAFSAAPTFGDTPLTVTFHDESNPGTSAITAWAWDFGDGGTGTARHPVHQYLTAGVYTVSLTVTTARGSDTMTKQDYITVTVFPHADFQGAPRPAEVGHQVAFTDLSTPGASAITAWAWNFGDGVRSSQRNPSHSYSSFGVFDVTLTVTNAETTDTEIKQDYIRVYALPQAAFSVSERRPEIDTAVTFTDESTAGSSPITTWLWDFGDGNQSAQQYPDHAYAVGGAYTVALTVSTAEGQDTELKQGYVNVVVMPTANFDAAPRDTLAGVSISFTDLSDPGTSPITAWLWDFDDNTTSTVQNPAHTYSAAGNFTVALTVTTEEGSDSISKEAYIHVVVPPTASFSMDRNQANVGEAIQFTDTSVSGTDPLESWAWNFGDGATSLERNPSHTYAAIGVYTVTLTVTAGAQTDSDSKTATIFIRPQADFSASPLLQYTNTPVQFTDLSVPGSQSLSAWHWDFGDSTSSSQQNPAHAYANAGTFTVALTATSSVGQDTEQKTAYVTIVPPLQARFTVFGTPELQSPATVEVGVPMQFSNLSTPGMAPSSSLRWNWDFGDGTAASTAQNPSHTYAQPGDYDVTLSVTSISPLEPTPSTLSRAAYLHAIYYPPIAGFSADDTTPWTDTVVHFANLTDPGSADLDQITWLWNFGDGRTSTEFQPQHVFLNPGTYSVSLTATSVYDSDVFSIANYITSAIEPPNADFTVDNRNPGLGEVIHFMDLSSGGLGAIVSWLWDFGDNTTSTDTHPNHSYSTEGAFTVTLTVTTNLGASATETKQAYINVGVFPPDASFIVSDTAPYRWETIQFTDTSDPGTGPITDWTWTFEMWAMDNEAEPPAETWAPVNEVASVEEEGYVWQHAVVEDLEIIQPSSSYAQNPSYIFYRDGQYRVTLTVQTPNGSSSASQTLTVQNVYPNINYSLDKDVIVYGIDSVGITDLSTIEGRGWITGFGWDAWLANYETNRDWGSDFISVGRNEYETRPESDFWYPFHEAGMYSTWAEIWATGLAIPGDTHDQETETWWAGDSVVREQEIEAREATPLDVFVRDYTGLDPDGPTYRKVTTLAGDGYKAYVLDLTSQVWPPPEFSVVTIPPEDSQWNHWLTIIVPDNRENNRVMLFLDDGPNGAPPSGADLTPTRGGGRLVFAVDFAKESGSTVAVLQGTLKQPLMFFDRPTEPLSGYDLLAYSLDKYLNGTGESLVDFIGAPDFGPAPLTVAFFDRSAPGGTPINTWLWDFGDGATSDEQNPVHEYAEAGLYDVTLTVTNDFFTRSRTRNAYIMVVEPGEQLPPGITGGAQAPSGCDDQWAAPLSDLVSESLVFETFSGVSSVSEVMWWGFEATEVAEGEPTTPGTPDDAGYLVSTVAPNVGPTRGGIPVKLSGRFLSGLVITSAQTAAIYYKVTFGGAEAQFDPTAPEIINASTVNVILPSTATCDAGSGAGPVEVRFESRSNSALFGSLPDGFTYFAGLADCDRNPDSFSVAFYSNDFEGIPGTLLSRTIAYPTRIDTGKVFDGARLYRYRVQLSTPLLVNSGWISIQGIGESECPFRWMASPDGDGAALLFAAAAEEPTPLTHDLSYFLIPGDVEIESHGWGEPNYPSSYRWPVLYPMVRSAVRAMDTVEDFLSSPANGGLWPGFETDGFVVSGGGISGWATWLTAVADPRVKAIIPMAYDGLSLLGQIDHQIERHAWRASPFFEGWDAFSQPIPPFDQAVFGELPRGGEIDSWYGSYFTAKMARKYLDRAHRDIMFDWYDEPFGNEQDHLPELAAYLTDPEETTADWTVLGALYSINIDGSLDMAISDIGWHEGDEFTGTIAHTLANMPGEEEEVWAFISDLIGYGNPGEGSAYDRFPNGRLGAIIKQIKNIEDNLLTNNYNAYYDRSYQSFLFHLIDPIYYNDRYTQYLHWWSEFGSRLRIPKLILNASGDEYFLPDASTLYFGQLDQPKWIQYFPNTDNAMSNTDFDLDGQSDLTTDFDGDGIADGGYGAILLSALPWYEATVANEQIPEITWRPLGEPGMIEVLVDQDASPTAVNLWSASSRNNDFRFNPSVNWDVVEDGQPLPKWRKFPLQSSDPGRYVVKISPTISDYTGFFVEVSYANGMTFTTTPMIVEPAVPGRVVPPTADFSATVRTVFPGTEIRFADFSVQGSAPITRWQWNFGDGQTSAVRNAKHTYTEPGVYTVSLIVIAADGSLSPPSDTLIRVGYITVTDPSPTAEFSASPVAGIAGETLINCTDLSTPGADSAAITTWLWDFGDGQTSGERNPIHVYQAGGSYDLTLTVTSASGWSNALIKPHHVHITVLGQNMGSALGTYVDAPDTNYTFRVPPPVSTDAGLYTKHVLRMTSQQWRTSADVAPQLWQHWLTIIQPDNLQSDSAMLIVAGGSNTNAAPSSDYTDIATGIALGSGSVVALLEQVPCEPLQFSDEAAPREEDEIIAYTFDKFLTSADQNAPDATWPLLLPMVKSVVRSMDAIQEFMAEEPRNTTIANFVVTGASKRGWTTWLTAAYDGTRAQPRVRAIAPMVFDVLNIDEQMDHHRKIYRNYFADNPLYHMYGGYSDAIADYTAFDIMSRLYTPAGQTLLSIVDPFEFRDRIRVPKLLINSTGDQFFPPDSAQFYFGNLQPGPNYLSYIPNTDHGLDDEATVTALTAFFAGVTRFAQLPQVSWTQVDANTLRIQANAAPSEVIVWTANNPDARDFRLDIVGPIWEQSAASRVGGNIYQANVPDPDSGWTAYMIQLKFASPLPGVPYIFSSPVKIVPDVYPEPFAR